MTAEHVMSYTILDKGNGYYSVNFRGMFCMTSKDLDACHQYIELQGGELLRVESYADCDCSGEEP